MLLSIYLGERDPEPMACTREISRGIIIFPIHVGHVCLGRSEFGQTKGHSSGYHKQHLRKITRATRVEDCNHQVTFTINSRCKHEKVKLEFSIWIQVL